MATVAPRTRAEARPIPVRTISNHDLRWSLRQGWEDFGELRGDLVFAGLIYTLLGLAAVVMTTSRPLMPFFFPVVAGVARRMAPKRLPRLYPVVIWQRCHAHAPPPISIS